MLTGGRSTSGVDNGLPGGRFEPLGPLPPTPVEVVSGRPSMADVETDFTSHFTSLFSHFTFCWGGGKIIFKEVLGAKGIVQSQQIVFVIIIALFMLSKQLFIAT